MSGLREIDMGCVAVFRIHGMRFPRIAILHSEKYFSDARVIRRGDQNWLFVRSVREKYRTIPSLLAVFFRDALDGSLVFSLA